MSCGVHYGPLNERNTYTCPDCADTFGVPDYFAWSPHVYGMIYRCHSCAETIDHEARPCTGCDGPATPDNPTAHYIGRGDRHRDCFAL